MVSIVQLAEIVYRQKEVFKGGRLFTVGISGIDASGKGHTCELLRQQLELKGLVVALVNTDPRQNPIPNRLNKESPALNIYENIFRWQDFF